jgi:hypothetical protein
MKEAVTETRPLILDALLKIRANFYVVTEWTPLPAGKARKEVNKRRRHFNMSKTGFVSQISNDAAQTNPRDVLVDESKQADIENLGDCLRALARPITAIVAESCPTKIFLANPEMNRKLYCEAFHLNDTELDIIGGLIPPGQMLIRKAQTSKKVHLNVDSVSHWMATNNARDNLKKREYFKRFGFADGLRHLAEDEPVEPRTLVVSTSNTNP